MRGTPAKQSASAYFCLSSCLLFSFFSIHTKNVVTQQDVNQTFPSGRELRAIPTDRRTANARLRHQRCWRHYRLHSERVFDICLGIRLLPFRRCGWITAEQSRHSCVPYPTLPTAFATLSGPSAIQSCVGKSNNCIERSANRHWYCYHGCGIPGTEIGRH